MFLIRFAIKRPVTTIMFYLALSMLGVISWGRLPVQLLPNLTFPQLFVQVSMPGASPEKIEKDLIIPVEEEIAKMRNVEKISSTARNDGGSLRIEFKLNTNMKYAALKLEQKVNEITARLPAGSRAFVGRNFSTERISNFLMQLSIRGEGDIDRLRQIAEEKIKPELEKVDGIVNINVSGGQRREVHIDVDQLKAFNYGIDLVSIQQIINANNTEKQYLGRVFDKNTTSFVTYSDEFTTLSDLEELVIDENIQLKLGDIADIKFAKEEQKQLVRINGKSSVAVLLIKDNVSNLLRTASLVETEIDRLNELLEPEGIEIAENFNAAEVMRNTITQVEKLAIVGAFLALLVLLFFLRNFKTVVVVIVSIPLSVLITFNIMYYAGLSINILSLVGIAIAVGMLVDNSIVVLENIFRHHELGYSPYEASLRGTTEVSRAIFASTATTVAVFLPTIFLQDKLLIIMKELSLAVIFPLLTSLLVAFTAIPMVASQFLKSREALNGNLGRQNVIEKWQRNRLMEIFSVFLKSRIRAPWQTIVFLVVFFIFTLIAILPFLTTSESPEADQQLPIYVQPSQNLGLEATDRIVRQVERMADSLDIVDEIRSLVSEDNATVTLDLMDQSKRGNLKNRDMKIPQVKDFFERNARIFGNADIAFENNSQAGSGGSGGDGGGGDDDFFSSLFGSSREKIIIKGFDQDDMHYYVENIKSILESMIEVRRVRTTLGRGALELQIWGDQAALDQNNLSMVRVMQALWSIRASGQELTSNLKDEAGDYLIRLKLNEEAKNKTIDDVKNLVIPVPDRGLIPVKNVSNFVIDEGSRAINRIDQQRQVEITFEFDGNLPSDRQFLDRLRARVDLSVLSAPVPTGFSMEIVRDESEYQTLYWTLGVAGLLIFMILSATFESIKFPWIIFSAIPLALIGTLWGMIITGTGLAPFTLMAMLVLLGIVVNNGIILIDYISVLRKDHKFSRNRAVIAASRARVRPILMTSLTTILGVLPFAFKMGGPNEIWPPFAIGLIGGLSFASLLTLVYLPVLYVSVDNFVNGLKKCGKPGVVFHLAANAAYVWLIVYYVEGVMWTTVNLAFGLFVLNAIIWNYYDYLDRRGKKISLGNELTISVRNLTKIYNEPSKFRKDWTRKKRKENFLREKGELHTDYTMIKESLLWKIPLIVFFGYLHTFFEAGFWIICLTIASYFLVANVFGTLNTLYRHKRGKEHIERTKWRKRFVFFTKLLAVFGMFIYILTRIPDNATVGVIYLSVWLFSWYARTVTGRIYRKEVVIHEINGLFWRTRRRFYRLLLKIPFIGRKKVELKALHAVNITIKNGMFGLLGPNGAGKSTLMRLISNIFYQSRGAIYFNGYKLSNYRTNIQSYIGYLPQQFGLYGNFTPWNFLNYLALMNKWGKKKERHELVESVLKNVNLWDRKDHKIKTFSGGMKQRVGIAQTLLNLPKIIVVDEPTSGLDPRERIRFRNMLSEMSKNRIVIFSTHIVEDISTSCRELAVLNRGKVVFQGTPEEMRVKADGKVWEALINEDQFQEWNKELNIVTHIKSGSRIKIKYIADDAEKTLPSEPVEPTLEDAYLHMLKTT